MRNTYQPAIDTAEFRACAASEALPTAQPHTTADERGWFVRAVSWFFDAIVEGFSTYGQSVCPCLYDHHDPYSQLDDRTLRDIGFDRREIDSVPQWFDPYRR